MLRQTNNIFLALPIKQKYEQSTKRYKLYEFVYFNTHDYLFYTGNIFDMEKQRQLELQREQIENEELRRRGEEELKKQQELGVSP